MSATEQAAKVDPEAMAKVDRALAEISAKSERIRRSEADIDQEREERNLLVFRTAEALRPLTGGRPTLMELARAMDVRHSYVNRLLKGKGYPVASGR